MTYTLQRRKAPMLRRSSHRGHVESIQSIACRLALFEIPLRSTRIVDACEFGLAASTSARHLDDKLEYFPRLFLPFSMSFRQSIRVSEQTKTMFVQARQDLLRARDRLRECRQSLFSWPDLTV